MHITFLQISICKKMISLEGKGEEKPPVKTWRIQAPDEASGEDKLGVQMQIRPPKMRV